MEFTDPPAETRGERSAHWIGVVEQLKANPGQWALVGNYSPGVATQIRRGKYRAFVPQDVDAPEVYMSHNWEVTTRKTDNGNRNNVFIRWVG